MKKVTETKGATTGSGRGGKREGSGRKSLEPTAVLRVQQSLVELVKSIQQGYKEAGCIPTISNKKDVTEIKEGKQSEANIIGFKPLLPEYGVYGMDEFKRMSRELSARREVAEKSKAKVKAYDALSKEQNALKTAFKELERDYKAMTDNCVSLRAQLERKDTPTKPKRKPATKMTDKLKANIRKASISGTSRKQIAIKFNVSASTVDRAVKNE